MNAAERFVAVLAPEAVRRLASVRVLRFDAFEARRAQLDVEEATAFVLARWGGDLCGLLNAMTLGELEVVARAVGVAGARSPELRLALWHKGAAIEAGGALVTSPLQPRPIVLGGHLVVQGPARGAHPVADAWPRALPAARMPQPPTDEPETLDDLLAAADRAIGVRLGARGSDKGAWGSRAARLLGVVERGVGEPDWRGDVELKTVSVAREPSGYWRIGEDPAIAMVGEGAALAKLQRTLWLARATIGDDATLVAWYLLDWDDAVARWTRRYLHVRPKGPAGTAQRAYYLHKRFFADAGLLAALNGTP